MKEKLLEIIADQFGKDVDELNPSINFKDDLNADSIDLVELVMSMEEEFNISVSDDELKNLNTIQDVLDFVEDLGK